MKKPPDPTLTLDTPFPRRSQRLSLGAVDDSLSSLFEFSSHLAYPLWPQSPWISGIDEYLSSSSRPWYCELSAHHYHAINGEIVWVMVYLPSFLFMMVTKEKPFSESGQIRWILYQILHLHPPTVFMVICYSGDQIFHSECKVTDSQRLLKFVWALTRSSGNFILPSNEANVKGYMYLHSSKSGVLAPFSN